MSTTSTPKTMSSRLLTMKFMQRAAHTPPTPIAAEEPSPKRRKTDSASSSPAKFNVDALADRSAIQAAIASEDAKREAALEKQAAEAGDTRWVLSFEEQKQFSALPSTILRVVSAGFATLDASRLEVKYEEEAEDKPVMVGRRSFGRFNRVIEKQQDPTIESSSESDSEDDDDEESEDASESDDEFDPTTQMIKEERRQAAERAKNERREKRKAAKAESEQLAKKRRKETPTVKLNHLTSLSGTNQNRAQTKPPNGMKCFNCGGDHFKRDCPSPAKRYHEGGDSGRPRKTQRQR